MAGAVFAQEAAKTDAPTLNPEDQIAILKINGKQKDIQVRYQQLYTQFLQSDEVTRLNVENSQLVAQKNDAINKAIANAKIDRAKWSVDQNTAEVIALPDKK